MVGARTLPHTPRSARRFDLRSASLNALAIGLLIVGLDGLADPGTRGLAAAALAASVAVGIVFVRSQVRPRLRDPVEQRRLDAAAPDP